MKRNTGKITALFIISVMALAGTSVGYALWSENLYINGTINTGELCAEFSYVTVSDPYSAAGERIDYVCDDGFDNIRPVVPPKDVGWMTGDISADGHTMTIAYNNVYPGYYGNVNFHLKNCGTIPWHYDHINLYCNGIYMDTWTSGTFIYACNDDYEIYYGNHLGDQVHPGIFLDISFAIHIFQGAEQGAIYTFTLEPVVIQYNEDWTGGYP